MRLPRLAALLAVRALPPPPPAPPLLRRRSPDRRPMASSAAAVDEGSPARRFWTRSRRETLLASYTPFVACLAAGVLRLDAFRAYIAQDAHFLRAYAKAYEMAEECADDDDDKVTISQLRKAVLEELKMHNSVVQEWGVDTTKQITPTPATLKYTDFLIGTASGKVDGDKSFSKIATPFERTKVAAYTIGAMTPCMRLYAYLGKELQSYVTSDGSGHQYKKWIETYSSNEFQRTALQIEELLDKLSISLTGEELEVIGRLYHQAMKLEVEFFLAQLMNQPVVTPLTRYISPQTKFIVFSDFDLTCSVVDSSAILAEISILSSQKAIASETDNLIDRPSLPDLRSSWNKLSVQYTEEYEQCIQSLLPSEEATQFEYDKLYQSLELLSDFEKRANERVVTLGVLKGMLIDDIRKAGERLLLQDGCSKFFQQLVKTKDKLETDVHILSYCWCADLIRAAFSKVGCVENLSIHSNEFALEQSYSTGEIDLRMQTPIDKVNKLKVILSSLGDGRQHLSVYIGDSVGDLLCLLEADVGIVVGSSVSLRRVGKQFGVSFVPLYPSVISKQRQFAHEAAAPVWKGRSGVLYTVSSWSEIHAFILGNEVS